MFEILVVKPLFNLLVLIYALIPGHNFGVAIILFTILIRFLMLPLLKKQLHHAKAIRELQPELKKIKAATKGDKQKESQLVMELYKERQVSPFGSLGILIVQFVILIGLYSGLRRVVGNPQAFIDGTYGFIRNLPWMQTLSADPSQFDATLLGFIDLTKPALSNGVWYFPGLLLVVGSAIAQFFQSSQLMPKGQDSRSLRTILKDASSGKQADQTEVNAAVMRGTRYLLPIGILVITLNIPSALSLYWLVGGLVAFMQQSRILKQDETELEEVADKSDKKEVIEGEVVETKPKTKAKKASKKAPAKKRRKR